MGKGALRIALIFVLAAILAVSGASASATLRNYSIDAAYSTGDAIRGTINISFANEPTSSVFKSNLKGEIGILDLLLANGYEEGAGFNCSAGGCSAGYTAGTDISSKEIASEPPLVGFKIIESEPVEITSLTLTLKSNAAPACRPTFWIDMLNMKEVFMPNYKTTGNVCETEYTGCFNISLDASDYQAAAITNSKYCEKITLPPAPEYALGANIKHASGRAVEVKMGLYDSSLRFIKDCKLPQNTSKDFEKLRCIVPYTSALSGDYFVCVSSTSSSGYDIKRELIGEKCGTSGSASELNKDYDIFASSLEFAGLDITIDEKSFENVTDLSLASYLDDYIALVYNRDCTNECVIPLRLYGDAQNVQFSNVELEYESGGDALIINSLNSLTESTPTLSSKYITLGLEPADWVVTSNATKNFILYLNGNQLLNKNIAVSATADFSVNPRTVYIGLNTEFVASTPFNTSQISSILWTFGDNTNGTSTSNKISHRYAKAGTFNMAVKITKKDKTILTKTFSITAANAQESAARLIELSEKRINNLTNVISKLTGFEKGRILALVNVSAINSSFKSIKTEYAAAKTEDKYAAVVAKLVALNVPFSISTGSIGTAPLALGLNNADMSYILSITNSEITNQQALKDNIIYWVNKNYNADIERKVVTAFGESGREDLVSVFKVTITEKAPAGSSYLIIGYPKSGITFDKSYSEAESSGGTYIPISGAQTIQFAVDGNIEIADLGMYLAPSNLSKFALSGGEISGPSGGFSAGYFLLTMFFLVLIFLVAYIIVQEWYKRNYEEHLFKRHELLVSVMKFITNSRNAGKKDDETAKKLTDAGWNKEQIRFAFNKVDGKKTGFLVEIPILKFWEKMRMKKELATGAQPSPSSPPQQTSIMGLGERKVY